MGFFSRLFASSGSSETKRHVFQIPWCSEGRTGDCELKAPRVFLSDIAGITAPNIAAIRQRCKEERRPLVLVTPGADRSVLHLLGEGDLMVITATDLPGQTAHDLLEDLAVMTDTTVLSKELGYGLSFPDSLSRLAEHGIVIPGDWEDAPLGTADWLVVNRDGIEFHWLKMSKGRQRQVQWYTTHLLQDEPTPGRDKRLRRLWTAAGCLPDEATAAAPPQPEPPGEYAFGLARPCFGECVFEDANVAVFSEPLNDLPVLVHLLGKACASGRPIVILAPSASDEAVAICVANLRRGIVQSAVAVPVTGSQDSGAVLAEIARRTNAKAVLQTEAGPEQGDKLWASLGRVSSVRVTYGGLALTPMVAVKESAASDASPAYQPARATAAVTVDNRVVPVAFSEGTLHLTGEFSGNLDLSLTFDPPIATATVLKNLRVKMPGKSRLLEVAGYREIARGMEITVYSELALPGQNVEADTAPATVGVYWLANSTREPVAQVRVVTVTA